LIDLFGCGNLQKKSEKLLSNLYILNETIMDIDIRLAAIEESQKRIIDLLVNKIKSPGMMSLKEAAQYVGFSPDHFRRLAVEQRIIPYSRPSEQQKGKLLFRRIDLDIFLEKSIKGEKSKQQLGRRRKSTVILTR